MAKLYEHFPIFLPLIILGVALLVRNPDIRNNQNTAVSPTNLPAASQSADVEKQTDIKDALADLDLEGPLVCNYANENVNVEVQIENKEIYSRIRSQENETNILLLDDCVYKWSSIEQQGKQTCGVGQYLQMFSSLKFLPIDPSFILNTFLSQQGGVGLDKKVQRDVLNACKGGEVDRSLFSLPLGRTFEEVAITEL